MKDIELSLRMKTVADMVSPGSRVCDIGCDHAFVSIYLVANGISDRVIASDVRTGPCAIARENIDKWGYEDNIDLRLGDGLSTVGSGEVDSIIIAGMGGMLMTDILDAGMNVVEQAKQIVLQPQSEIEHVRRYVYGHGWTIVDEYMLVDAGKYYVVMNIDVTQEEPDDWCNKSELSDIYYKYGYVLMNRRDKVLGEYLTEKKNALKAIVSGLYKSDTENAARRATELEYELECIDKALEYI